jgi:hypothetical protein
MARVAVTAQRLPLPVTRIPSWLTEGTVASLATLAALGREGPEGQARQIPRITTEALEVTARSARRHTRRRVWAVAQAEQEAVVEETQDRLLMYGHPLSPAQSMLRQLAAEVAEKEAALALLGTAVAEGVGEGMLLVLLTSHSEATIPSRQETVAMETAAVARGITDSTLASMATPWAASGTVASQAQALAPEVRAVITPDPEVRTGHPEVTRYILAVARCQAEAEAEDRVRIRYQGRTVVPALADNPVLAAEMAVAVAGELLLQEVRAQLLAALEVRMEEEEGVEGL